MVFANEEHEKFYFEKPEQARYQDCYHKALIYTLGISEDTGNPFRQIYDIKSGHIKTKRLHEGWQTSVRKLAVDIDRFTYDYDTALYYDNSQSMTENVSELTEALKQRDTNDIVMWLADVVAEGRRRKKQNGLWSCWKS